MESDIKENSKGTSMSVLEPSDRTAIFPAVRAPHHHLTEEDIIRFMKSEAAAKHEIGNLLNGIICNDAVSGADNTNKKERGCLDESGRPLSKRKTISRKMEAFNIDKFV